ncbi:MAG TPA: SCO family protein [Geobacteraceae bacterium]|nr:SCO family protein [Geobacteraceae bacterium]
MILKKYLALLQLLAIICASFYGNPAFTENRKYKRSIESYTPPDVVLVNQDGAKVRFKNYIETDKPVVLDFIYGTCTTICPVLSAGYFSLQKRMGSDVQKVRLVSITIDPENDTPKVMKEYLARYHAKPGWDFLTGSRSDIDRIMRAFNAYIPNKMSHYQLTLIRSPKDGKWTRIKELISGSDLFAECKEMQGK